MLRNFIRYRNATLTDFSKYNNKFLVLMDINLDVSPTKSKK